MQTLYAQNDKDNCVDFYFSVFPGEAEMCLGFMSFRARSAALKQKNFHNSPNMQPIVTLFQVLFKFIKKSPFDYRFKIIKHVTGIWDGLQTGITSYPTV